MMSFHHPSFGDHSIPNTNKLSTYKYSYPVFVKYIVTILPVDLSPRFFFFFFLFCFVDSIIPWQVDIYFLYFGLPYKVGIPCEKLEKKKNIFSIVITFPIFSARLFSTENFIGTCEIRLHNVSFNCLKSYNNTTFCTLAFD